MKWTSHNFRGLLTITNRGKALRKSDRNLQELRAHIPKCVCVSLENYFLFWVPGCSTEEGEQSPNDWTTLENTYISCYDGCEYCDITGSVCVACHPSSPEVFINMETCSNWGGTWCGAAQVSSGRKIVCEMFFLSNKVVQTSVEKFIPKTKNRGNWQF